MVTRRLSFAVVAGVFGITGASMASADDWYAAIAPNHDSHGPVVWDTTREAAKVVALAACRKISKTCAEAAWTDDRKHLFALMCCKKPKFGCAISAGPSREEAKQSVERIFEKAGYSGCVFDKYISAETGKELDAPDLFINVDEVEISQPFAVAQQGGEEFKNEAFAYFQAGNQRETLNMEKPFCVVVVYFDPSTDKVLPRTLTVTSRDGGGRAGIKTGQRAANLHFEDPQVKRIMCTNAVKGADELPSKELMRGVLGSYLSLR